MVIDDERKAKHQTNGYLLYCAWRKLNSSFMRSIDSPIVNLNGGGCGAWEWWDVDDYQAWKKKTDTWETEECVTEVVE